MKKSFKLLFIAVLFLAAIAPLVNIPAKTSQATEIVISTGVQTTTSLTDMITEYNALGKDYTVKLQESTWETQNQHDTYVTKLAAQDDSIDIISMDVIWPPEFTAAGWLEPLDDMFTGEGYSKDDFLEAPILAGTYEGKQYGIPWFHDSAMLYYRADIIEYAADEGIIPANRAPQTWAELRDWTRWMLADDDLVDQFKGTDGLLEGFVWQAREYEGMICDFMEYLGGTGQYSFLIEDNTKAGFNTSEARETLTYMKSLFDQVNITESHADGRLVRTSPEAVLTYQEETSRAIWNAGNAIFHRNWPYCYRLSLNDAFLNGSEGSYLNASLNSEKVFGVTPMPPKDASVTEPRTSCLGGWQLGLNKYSKHKTEAKEFMKWLTDTEQQKKYLLENGQLPTRKALYSDASILADPKVGYIGELYSVFLAALPRPVHPDYPAMSKAIWAPMHTYLAGGYSLNEATEKMDEVVDEILTGGEAPSGIPDLAIIAIFSAGALVILRKKKRT
jgi:multiple sugar transport system substrate-binding protein